MMMIYSPACLLACESVMMKTRPMRELRKIGAKVQGILRRGRRGASERRIEKARESNLLRRSDPSKNKAKCPIQHASFWVAFLTF